MTVRSLKNKNNDVLFGDATSPDLLKAAGVETARLVAITLPNFLNEVSAIKAVRDMNKNIFIVTRARYRHLSEKLYEAGADVVVSDELESSLEMSRHLLLNLGVSAEECETFLKKIHEFGSADFF